MSRYQIAKENIKEIFKDVVIEEKLYPNVSMLNRIKTAKAVRQWIQTENQNQVLRKRAIRLINTYGLGLNLRCMFDTVCIQLRVIDSITNEEEQNFQLALLKQRVSGLIYDCLKARTMEELELACLNCGYPVFDDTAKKIDKDKPKPDNKVGFEFTNLGKHVSLTK